MNIFKLCWYLIEFESGCNDHLEEIEKARVHYKFQLTVAMLLYLMIMFIILVLLGLLFRLF